jgi:hypothetical protein
MFLVAACTPGPAASHSGSPSASPASSPAASVASPNPVALAQNDCTSPPPTSGTKTHSSKLAATVTLPAGWVENTADEGKSGAEAAFALELASGTRQGPDVMWGDSYATAMTAHEAAVAEAAYTPGSGTVMAKGDCIIAGSQASFFESSVAVLGGGGFVLYIGHRGVLVRFVILFSSDTRDSTMPQVKSILGSWQWDKP